MLKWDVLIPSQSNYINVIAIVWGLQSPLGKELAISKDSLWHSISQGALGKNPDYTSSPSSGFVKPVATRDTSGKCGLFKKHSPTFFQRFFRGNCVCSIFSFSFVYCIPALFMLRLLLVWIGFIKGYWDSSCFTNWLRQGLPFLGTVSWLGSHSAETVGDCSLGQKRHFLYLFYLSCQKHANNNLNGYWLKKGPNLFFTRNLKRLLRHVNDGWGTCSLGCVVKSELGSLTWCSPLMLLTL